MEENRIMIKVPNNLSIIAGPSSGEECFKACKGDIDSESINILVFPNHVTQVIGSFFTGFFKELRRDMTPGELKEHFSFDQSMPCRESAEKAFNSYISNYL